MANNFKPLSDRVLVQREALEKKTLGGLVLPDSASSEKSTRGTVMAVGPGKIMDNGDRRPVNVQVGQKVIFGKYAGTEISDQNRRDEAEYVILREEDLLAVEA